MNAHKNEKIKIPSNAATSAEFTYRPVHEFIMQIMKCWVLSHLSEIDKGMELDLDGRHETVSLHLYGKQWIYGLLNER